MWTALAALAIAYCLFDVIAETKHGRIWSVTR